MSRTIAILTGGGDCPGLNAVIRSVVRTAVNQHNWKVIGIQDGFDGLVGNTPRWVELGTSEVKGLLARGGTILGTSNRGNPFSYPVTIDGKSKVMDISSEVIKTFHNLGADALIAVGGDGTLRIALGLAEKGLNVIGVPKTIDNDLRATDVTFGYRTAVSIVTEALDRLHTTAESHQRAIIVEVMGRDAGWIALESGIAGSADAILIPEIPYSIEKLCDSIRQRRSSGSKFSIIVVAEGAASIGGKQSIQEKSQANFGAVRFGGIAHEIADQMSHCIDIETRVVTLGHLQRGGSPVPYDRILATRFGVKAVELIAAQEYSKMVSLKGTKIESVDLSSAVSQQNLVDPDCELVATAESLGICMGR